MRLFAGGTIWKHLWVTLSELMLAFAIGSIAGVLVGFWFARKPAFAAVFDPYVKMINALPRVVLAPIFTLWFGLGIWSKVALGVTLVFFIVFFNVYQGVKEVSPTVLANARMLGMGERAADAPCLLALGARLGCSPRSTPRSASRWSAPWSANISALPRASAISSSRPKAFSMSPACSPACSSSPSSSSSIDAGVSVVERRLLVWRPVVGGGARLRRNFHGGHVLPRAAHYSGFSPSCS